VNHRLDVHNGFNLHFFKQDKIFRDTKIYGNKLNLGSNWQPFEKNFNLQDNFFRYPQCSAAGAGSEEF
jgi:hypothetical protein